MREVLQTESGSIFGKVRVRVLTGQGQSTHEHVQTESLFCKQKIDFRFHFRFGQFRWRSDWGLSRRFWRKPCCSRVTKWQSGPGEEERLFFFTLACFARQCGAGLIINEAAADLFYTRESRKRRVNGKGTKEKEDTTTFTLMIRDVVFLLLFPFPLHRLLSTNKIHFFRLSHDTVRGRDRWCRNSLEFGAGKHTYTGEDEIDAVELDDLENDDIPYCYYYLRVLYFANFCDLEKIANISTRKNFYRHIWHSGVCTITNCVMFATLEHAKIILFWSFLPFFTSFPCHHELAKVTYDDIERGSFTPERT